MLIPVQPPAAAAAFMRIMKAKDWKAVDPKDWAVPPKNGWRSAGQATPPSEGRFARSSEGRPEMLRINGDELNARWREFLSEIRRVMAARQRVIAGHHSISEDAMQAGIKEAQDKITEWFAQQGIELYFEQTLTP